MPARDGWDELRRLRQMMCSAEVALVCAEDVHLVGRAERQSADLQPEPMGPLRLPGIEETGTWCDGRGNSLSLFSGLLEYDDDSATARWTAPCRWCQERGESATPQVSWRQILRLLDHAEQHAGRLRVPIPRGGFPGC